MAKSESSAAVKILLLLGAVVAIAFGLVVAAVLQPPPKRPPVSITLQGYTNDSTGTRLAVWSVTNLGPSSILTYAPRAEIPSTQPGGIAVYNASPQVNWYTYLASGTGWQVAIPVPTNGMRWRLAFYASNDYSLAQIIRRLWIVRRQIPFTMESPWIETSK